MTTTKVVLRFPPDLTDQPITYKLIKEYDLMVNILRGHITPKEEGMLVLWKNWGWKPSGFPRM